MVSVVESPLPTLLPSSPPSSLAASSASASAEPKQSDVVFVGNGADPVNVHSVAWFLGRVWPLARSEIARRQQAYYCAPAAAAAPWFTIIGADWDTALLTPQRRLSSPLPATAASGADYYHAGADSASRGDTSEAPTLVSAENIRVLGFLSEADLSAALARHAVFASPMVASTGINTKNLLALAHGLPLITTALGAEGSLEVAAVEPREEGPQSRAWAVMSTDNSFAMALADAYLAATTTRSTTDPTTLSGTGGGEEEGGSRRVSPEKGGAPTQQQRRRRADDSASGRAHLRKHFSRAAQDSALSEILTKITAH